MLFSYRALVRAFSSRRHRQALLLVVLFSIAFALISRIQSNTPSGWSVGLAHVEKLAFATMLTSYERNAQREDLDEYFVSVRLLNYQMRFDMATRSARGIPFLVLVTPGVLPWKREQLQKEGATIVPVDKLESNSSWLQPGAERWQDVMAKLRLFELVEYDRILFLDADTFLLKPLDGVFHDPGATPRLTLNRAIREADEGSLPENYVFGTSSEVLHTVHSYPPVETELPYFNAGFFVLSPSKELFNHYYTLLNIPARFDSTYPEQNLLNYAHRQDGNMPWSRIFYGWNINLPNMNDVDHGVASVHAKLWNEGTLLKPNPPELQDLWQRKRMEMERFYWDSFGLPQKD